jgi:molybdopterin converting factor small subunit
MPKKKWSVADDVTPADLEDAVSELREKYEEMSERWQEGDKGQAVSDWLYRLDTIVDDYNSAVSELDENREPSE